MADRPLSRNVKALGVVSLLADVASEMIYPLLPLFLTGVLGAGATMLGAIEGIADSTSSFLKLASGWWSDRVRRRKPLVVVGYVLSAVARPLIGLATASWHVLAVRVTDRTGKGIRTSPRDALLADSSHPAQRGRAYGFHRALDNVGAVLGPLLAWILLEMAGVSVRAIFLWAAVPGAISIAVLVWFVRETRLASNGGDAVATPSSASDRAEPTARGATSGAASEPAGPPAPAGLGAPFWRYLAVLFVFTLGASTDAFLLLRARDLGVPLAMIPILYAALNLVKAASSTPGGALSDRFGRRPLILSGWALYAVVYLGFAAASAPWHAWALFLCYGVFFGLTEGTEKALVADLVPAERRGTAFGWFHFAIGAAALPASLIFGLAWDRVGPGAAFVMGASLAGAAAIALLALVPSPPPRRGG